MNENKTKIKLIFIRDGLLVSVMIFGILMTIYTFILALQGRMTRLEGVASFCFCFVVIMVGFIPLMILHDK